ncbi:hypothetical protein AVEN_196647-1 [Araneus ventricosus]|uniref:Uncharacterized protein n=1 Tax=Araneus ventricosus TaxID=182803 RepID=A0A4Y2E395_ARAVE|nr:hypothetical protein AVEN_196647-1 [Araneus ventricosus]
MASGDRMHYLDQCSCLFDIFGVMLKTDLLVSPLSHSACQSERESSSSWFFRKLFGNGRLTGISSVVASFARVSAISLPFMPMCALTQPNLILAFPRRVICAS